VKYLEISILINLL